MTNLAQLVGASPELAPLVESPRQGGTRECLDEPLHAALCNGATAPVAGERSGQATADATSPPENGRAVRQRCN